MEKLHLLRNQELAALGLSLASLYEKKKVVDITVVVFNLQAASNLLAIKSAGYHKVDRRVMR